MRRSSQNLPEQTGFYRVKVKNGAGWKMFDTARMQISVGQEYHEGEKLEATIDWLKHRFDHVIICVNDTLQRYNLYFDQDISEHEALKQSYKAGQEWILRNIDKIRELPSFEIHRWEDWRNRSDYSAQLKDIESLYQTKDQVKKAIDNNVQEFWHRIVFRQPDIAKNRFDDFAKHSTNYLIEETAAFFLMFKHARAVDIYPGSVLLPCVLGQEYSLYAAPDYLGQRAFTRIDFSRNENEQRQQKFG